MSLLEIRNLSVQFPTAVGTLKAVDGVDLDVDPGEVVAIVGESGSGKSVSMLAVMGLLPTAARITADRLAFDGRDLLKIDDAARRKIIGKEIAMAVKAGGPNPDANSRLKVAIQNARGMNMPKDNVDRAIKKAAGGEEADYHEVTYEGYAPGGVAVFVDAATNNVNRTVGNVRSYFSKCGGNLGTSGSLGHMFERKAEFVIAEVSVANRFEGSYRFAEFIGLMDSKGWELTDILRAPRRVDSVLFIDAVFARAGSQRRRVEPAAIADLAAA